MVHLDFDLITAEYDLKNSPRPATDEIRQLARNPLRFDQLRQELPKHVFDLESDTTLFRVREHNCEPTEPWPSHDMRGHPDFPWARANVDGQPVIYCADSVETAFAEVRAKRGPWLRSRRFVREAC